MVQTQSPLEMASTLMSCVCVDMPIITCICRKYFENLLYKIKIYYVSRVFVERVSKIIIKN